jgi:predicted kinase
MSFQSEINKLPKEIVQQLKDTPQSPKWHPEGNCYNHVWMVYDSILKSPQVNKKDLLICALFHDLGKINATREKIIADGSKKIVAYGHEVFANDYLNKYLDLFDYDDKEMIYEVCANHMKAHLFDRMKESRQKRFMENEYFTETITFSTFDDMSKSGYPKFIMTVGIPGSGKSRWVNSYKEVMINPNGLGGIQENNYEVVCPDQIRKEITGHISDITQDQRVWKIVKERVIEYLKEGKNVILDSTMVKSRKEFIKDLPLCFRYAKVFRITPEEAIRRIQKDIENNVDRSKVPDSVVFKMYENFVADISKLNDDGFDII